MLTISAPIEIKAKSTYLRDPEAFYHRIVGNYSLMETQIGEEDLLHIASTPPEIYVQEGEGMTSILQYNERNETNLNKVDILNNVLNRIVASADVNLTYQDRVFITDALYKLGVRDDRRFMKAFYQIAEETRNTNTLINLYLERGGELRELIEEVESRERDLVSSEKQTTETERENYLYNTVMDRLNTGAIYQIVSNFNRTIDNNNIDSSEYAIANQSYTAQHILLSVLRDRAGVGEENLVFLNENTYEETLENQENLSSSVKNEITAAVLMDMVKNIYHTGFDRFYTNNETFYRFEDTFFKSSDQTFLRLVGGSQENYFTQSNETDNYYTENNRLTSSEIELLETRPEGEMSQEELTRLTETVNAINVQNEKRRLEYVRTVDELRTREEPQNPLAGLSQTKKDAVLALSEPEKLMEKLGERTKKREKRRKEVLSELRNIIPDQSMEIYQLLEQYYEGNSSVVNSIVRKADVGELIYDINDVEAENKAEGQAARTARIEADIRQKVDRLRQEKEAEPPKSPEVRMQEIYSQLQRIFPGQSMEIYQLLLQYYEGNVSVMGSLIHRIDSGEFVYSVPERQVPKAETAVPRQLKREPEVEESLSRLRMAREEEQIRRLDEKAKRMPVETVHRLNETITAEDLTEQLNTMESNIRKNVKKDVETRIIEENRVTHQTEIHTNETQVSHLTARDVQQLVENGVKSQMSTISNQVLTKLERQMKNEKMRRGY